MYSKAEQKRLMDLTGELKTTPAGGDAKKIDSLREVLIFHEWRYSVLNDPLITDYDYDQLYKQLEAIEAAHPDLIIPDSPTQRVSNDLTETFNSVPHLAPMLSLANSYNAEDLQEFDKQIKKLALLPEESDVEYCVEPKFDGGSIALIYEGDQLSRGATRGNGQLGEEMTSNARAIRSIPLKANFSAHGIQQVELRGEVLIRKDNFVEINKKRGEAGLSLFANPRNAATGGLRMKDPKEVAQRGLEAFIYQLGYAVDAAGESTLGQLKTHDEGIEMLGELGFKVPTIERKVCSNIKEVADFCAEWEGRRENYSYEIDGMVVKVNSLALQEQCGFTSHHPRWAIAYKFKAKQASTRLLSIEYQVGKIGSITPVAKVEPVQLAGVTVSSVSLHNEDFIRSKDIRMGDMVLVERAGDVIPYIVKPLSDLRDGSEKEITFPQYCPINEEENVALIRQENEAAWRCPNCTCGMQDLQRMVFHVSKGAMDIDGFGKSYVERFFEMGWLRSLADIYRLDYQQIAELEGFGEKSANNLKAAIEKAKNNPLHRLLHSLTIHHLGKKASKLLAAQVESVFDLANWTTEDFVDIKDVGPVVAENVVEYFSQAVNIALLRELESLGVNVLQTEDDKPKVANEDGPLFGKTILFTGTLTNMSRKEAQEKAEAAGARNISAVSSKLNILVAGEKAGSKLKKAQALGTVQVLSEEEYIELISVN